MMNTNQICVLFGGICGMVFAYGLLNIVSAIVLWRMDKIDQEVKE